MRTRRLHNTPAGTRKARYAAAGVTVHANSPASHRVATLAAETDRLVHGIDQALVDSHLRLRVQSHDRLRAARLAPPGSTVDRPKVLRGIIRLRELQPGHYRLDADEWADIVLDGDDDD